MLMIDGITFTMLDKVDDVRDLHDRDAILFQDSVDGRHEAVQVSDVRQHIIRKEHVGAAALLGQFRRCFGIGQIVDGDIGPGTGQR